MSSTNSNVAILYDKYYKLIENTCKRFTKQIYYEELDDLTQSAWEQIIRKYDNFDESKSPIKAWLVMVTKSTMYNIIRDNNREKRKTLNEAASLESLINLRDKYL